MRLLRLVPYETNVPFMRVRNVAIAVQSALLVAAMALFFTVGLNLGIDFRGGSLIEIGTEGPADIAELRQTIGGLGLGEVQIQQFGTPNDVLIRVAEQEGGEAAQQAVITKIRGALGDAVEYRRVEIVGPTVSEELARSGVIAVLAAVFGILIYLWFRFEWQYAIGAVLATVHDLIMTIGLFAVLQLEFNLTSIAAILTIVGYSLNDTVVVCDRVRENLRRFKRMPLVEVIDLSLNQTLARTVMTSVTTLIALFSLYFFGGEVIRSFVLAMIWGVFVGTYSSIYVTSPTLLYFRLNRDSVAQPAQTSAPAG